MAMNMARGRDYILALYLKSQLEYARRNHQKAIKLLVASINLKSCNDKKQVLLDVAINDGNNKQGSTTSRSRTKVQMQGVPVGRAVDLTVLESYDDLISELEKLFDIKGELCPKNKWEIVYTDDEGDMMLVGDDPWPEFCKIARKIFIYSSEEVKKMAPGVKQLPLSSFDGEEATASLDSELKSEA